LDLQKLARAQGRNTQQLFELYIHERFLARLADSRFSEMFVLKGGMLLAVLEVRRPTRDADMLARGIANDEGNLRAVVGEIAAISMADGLSFDATEISITSIREDADYHGVRLALPTSLAGAVLKLRLDLSFGDPVKPQRIDYGDVYLLSEIHPVEAEPLRQALHTVAEHRNHVVRPLGPLLETLRETRQQSWEAFRTRVGLTGLPERFSDVVDGVVDFLDGLHTDGVSRWNPTQRRWE
jgi:hypothetical protein